MPLVPDSALRRHNMIFLQLFSVESQSGDEADDATGRAGPHFGGVGATQRPSRGGSTYTAPEGLEGRLLVPGQPPRGLAVGAGARSTQL